MEQGLLDFFGVKCVYTQLNDEFLLFPIDESQHQEFYRYSKKVDYLLRFCSSIYKDSYIHVKKTAGRLDHSISLEPTFIAKMIENEGVSKMRIQGDELDVFYSPSRYFFIRKSTNESDNYDLKYEKAVAFSYCFYYLGKQISAEISFGKILSAGVRSDLILHPTLELTFDKTTNIEFVYGLYMVILRFLQFVNHKQSYNMLHTELMGNLDDHLSSLGFLYNHHHIATHLHESSEAQYLYFGIYIENILNLFASECKIPFKHFPNNGDSWKYDAFRFAGVFAAFEYECDKQPELYKNASDDGVKTLKQRILGDLLETDTQIETVEEKSFLDHAKSRIAQLWTEFGQAKKIENAYFVLQGALSNSIDSIFPFKDKDKTIDDQIKETAGALSSLRGRVLHGELNHIFSDEENRNIRFLDILSYAQTLKRAKIPDDAIELILGCVFSCNYKYHDFYFSLLKENTED